MNLIDERQKLFDEKFHHSEDCEVLRFADFEKEPWADCYCQLKEIKAFIQESMELMAKSVIEDVKTLNQDTYFASSPAALINSITKTLKAKYLTPTDNK